MSDQDELKLELIELVKLFGLYNRTAPEIVDAVVEDILQESQTDAL